MRSKNIFVISKKDVQSIALKKFGEKLSVEELEQVKKVEFGLECWEEVVIEAISEILECRKKENSTKN
ncbi:hypothetical protein DRH29_06020 [candidate division Kazan bacterium]|uniref:Uncharacterized protein n=1 Tax=candidate division Kazan bacterium TaxID=2202143 RepID=A0A420ZAL2_UNCK3|nr:MAG: hypothetical protein DRH29_06020 [candidate division Kazan bacterium]